jgi:hypothetical protein
MQETRNVALRRHVRSEPMSNLLLDRRLRIGARGHALHEQRDQIVQVFGRFIRVQRQKARELWGEISVTVRDVSMVELAITRS